MLPMVTKECQIKKHIFKIKFISVTISTDNFDATNEQKYAHIYQKCKISLKSQIQN